jgi:hypothetical protein
VIDTDLLLTDAKKQVVSLIEDLRTVAATGSDAEAHIATEYERAHAVGRTAFSQTEWAEGLFAQVAVAWVLGCVLVRFCEDNGLIEDPLLGGPGIRSQIALDHRAAHLKANPAHDDRHWLRAVFGHLRSLPATGDIFGGHNLVWVDGLQPSADGARKLREELTRRNPETGELHHDFTDPSWDTRFLGDLYQDLSEDAKKTYALLQTPVFVEEFILDRTLDPAIATFGLADTTVIDPTCGSGHFLLGAFARLFSRWVEAEPTTNRRELARRALDAIGGIDLNPFAASIARFRLLVAALRAGGDSKLSDAPAYEIHIAVGDSLLHGDPPGSLPGMHVPGEEESLLANHGYEAEDIAAVRELLGRRWSAVVGNPPYIIVKDPALNSAYRRRFSTCSGKYSLGVPFTERFWQLARSDSDPARAGFVGMITTNSFMKREMGKKLIQQWVPEHDLTTVIDSSLAYIPGHGTPTVLLFGRNRSPVAETIRVVLGQRGEPTVPVDPAFGSVWLSIAELADQPGSRNEYVIVSDLDREMFCKHPWTIGEGGSVELKDRLFAVATKTLGEMAPSVGFHAITGEDAFFLGFDSRSAPRVGIPDSQFRRLGYGEVVRDWRLSVDGFVLFPYELDLVPAANTKLDQLAWAVSIVLDRGLMFGKTRSDRGLRRTEYAFLSSPREEAQLTIAFAFVGTHNHFVVNRGGRVFHQSAPLVNLLVSDSDSVYGLISILNSSTIGFLMRLMGQDKGTSGGIVEEAYDRFFMFSGAMVERLPIPTKQLPQLACELDELGEQLNRTSVSELLQNGVPSKDEIALSASLYEEIRGKMISLQERLDWEVYKLYGLTDEDLTSGEEAEPSLELGERAFEIVLARKMATDGASSSWFTRHGSTPITELPTHWPEYYKRVVEQRIEAVETDPNIGLIERPENKRRWAAKSWDEQTNTALRCWLLDRLESPAYWSEPAAITTVARLTSALRTDPEFLRIVSLLEGRDDIDITVLVSEMVKSESVPYLATLRFTDSGMRKHAVWIETWELQRRLEVGENVGIIPSPPKYTKADFKGVAWDHRGKLDVPKERFISYPGAERETDASMVIGWAGWNHLDRARALAAWYLQARRDGRDADHLAPLLVGLAELVPWLKQWHDEPNPDPALDRPGTQIAALLDTEMRSLGLTAQDLTAWRRETKRSGRTKKTGS